MLKHGGLFEGLGANLIAAEQAGFKNEFFCEIDEFCNTILNYWYPELVAYEDIRKTDFSIWRGKLDVLSGGDPCQRNSNANRSGNEVTESLAGEFIREIQESMPRWVVRENPSKIRKDAPWPAWRFAAELENMGYIVPTPFKLRACCIGGQIQRERMFVLGYLPGTDSPGLEGNECKKMEKTSERGQNANITRPDWRNSAPRICGKYNGVSEKLSGITFPAWKKKTLKSLGNSVPPQMIYKVFQLINDYEKLWTH